MTPIPTGLLRLMWQDLLGSRHMRALWVFCASLVLGITLISACSNLLQLVQQGLHAQQQQLFGGDVQVSQRVPVTQDQLAWMQENGEVSLLLELRTMLGTENGDFTVVELQSVDAAYPLYGSVELSPDIELGRAVSQNAEGLWGAAFDPVLAEQLQLQVGDKVFIGSLQIELRAMINKQPDRSLRADVRGPPVIVDESALMASGLVLPTSLIDYDYRVRTGGSPEVWRDNLRRAFPLAEWEVQTINERSDRIAERLDQVASVLLLIGFSTLFIGGLGVANSISAYLKTKYGTLATLQAIGCREAQTNFVFCGQVIILSLFASSIGAVLGSTIALVTAQILSAQLPLSVTASGLVVPTLLASLFGVVTALLFTLPMLGRTLSLSTAQLIKGNPTQAANMPRRFLIAMITSAALLFLLLLALVPQPLTALAFVITLIGLYWLLERIVVLIKRLAAKLAQHPTLDGRIVLRLAAASVAKEGSSLRPMLLSLGLSLTLLVAAAVIVRTTVTTLNDTVPSRAPSLVFYDLQASQREGFEQLSKSTVGFEEIATTPLVLGRLTHVNEEALFDSDIAQRALEANDEHKLSYRHPGIDNVTLADGEWWPENYTGKPLVAMEDREANQLGLQVGDRLVFSIMGQSVEATLSAIYSQARFETSFWLEAVFTQPALEPFISRHIGSIHYNQGADINAMSVLAAEYPNVVMIRTAKVLASAKSILAGASIAIFAIAVVSLFASILVMASVVAVSRQLQVYQASVMHALGARRRLIMMSVVAEYALLTVILTLFAGIVGTAIGWAVNHYWLALSLQGNQLTGLAIAGVGSSVCLIAGAWWLLRSLSAKPAMLLKQQPV